VGDGINDEMKYHYYTGRAPQAAAPKLEWVDWKEKRPAQMLGMTKQELRTWREYGLGVDCLRTWKELDTLPCGVHNPGTRGMLICQAAELAGRLHAYRESLHHMMQAGMIPADLLDDVKEVLK